MDMQTTLPGLAPRFTRFDLERQDDGYWTLRVWSGDRVGLVTRAEMTTYDGCTLAEAVDVVDATVSCWRNA